MDHHPPLPLNFVFVAPGTSRAAASDQPSRPLPLFHRSDPVLRRSRTWCDEHREFFRRTSGISAPTQQRGGPWGDLADRIVKVFLVMLCVAFVVSALAVVSISYFANH